MAEYEEGGEYYCSVFQRCIGDECPVCGQMMSYSMAVRAEDYSAHLYVHMWENDRGELQLMVRCIFKQEALTMWRRRR